MRRLLIVKTGRALPRTLARLGDFHHWISRAMAWSPERCEVVAVFEDASRPPPS
jgi:hypothetical protein